MSQGAQQSASHTIDVAFRITGDRIPVDHGYALYAALARVPGAGPWLHDASLVAIHLIRGHYAAPGVLRVTPTSRLTLRLAAAELPYILPLAGQAINLDGHSLRIGVPQTTLLRPATSLYAHAVTTRNGHDEARFDAEIARQLDGLEIAGKPIRGKRRVLHIKDKTVVAHTLLVTELTAADALHLQKAGLGGRRKMGCGIFMPAD